MKVDVRKSRQLAVAITVLFASAGLLVSLLNPGTRDAAISPAFEVAAAVLGEITVSEPIVLIDQPRLVLERGTLMLDHPGGRFSRQAGNPGAALRSGEARLVLLGARFTFDPGQAGALESGSEHLANGNPLLSALSKLSFEHLDIRKATFVVKRASREEAFEDVNAEISASAGGTLDAGGTATLRGETLKLAATLGAGALTPQGAEHPLKLKLSGGLLDASFDGKLKLGSILALTATKATLQTANLRKAANWLGARWSEGPGLAGFSANGAVDWRDGRLSFDRADFEIDGNAATGNLSLSLTAGLPFIEGTLAFGQFEISPYKDVDQETGPTKLLSSSWPTFSFLKSSDPGSVVREIEADLRISAASVTSSGERLGRGAVSVAIDDRVLEAELAEVVIEAGGTGLGQLTVDMNGPEALTRLNGRLDNIDLSPIAALAPGQPLIVGRGSIDADIQGTGASFGEFAATATGPIKIVSVHDGSLSLNLSKLVGSAQGGPAKGWGAAAGSTPFQSFSAEFSAEAGVLRGGKLEASSPSGLFTAVGTINPLRGALNLTLHHADRLNLDGSGAPARSSVEIKGPLHGPAIRKATPSRTEVERGAGVTPLSGDAAHEKRPASTDAN